MVDIIFWFLLFFLIVFSGFFSGAEVGMLSVNRYRLRHLARKKSKKAQLILSLLERPERMIGVILLGNTFSNILASSIATFLAVQYFGEVGVLYATVIMTMVLLIVSETAPKTMAVVYPKRFAFFVIRPLWWLLRCCYPLVLLINFLANTLLKCFSVHSKTEAGMGLSADELKSVVVEAKGKISDQRQKMLLRILELDQVTVADVMIPKSDLIILDIKEDWMHLYQKLRSTTHDVILLYQNQKNNLQGLVRRQQLLAQMVFENFEKKHFLKLIEPLHFIPETVPLGKQLINFQNEAKMDAMVVDEYGEVQGMVTMQDILEEVVGEFSKQSALRHMIIQQQKDESYIIDGGANVRDLNRQLGWLLPIDGPNTLSGLIIEYLENIPTANVCLRLAGYPMEILKVEGNTIDQVRVLAGLYH